MAGNDSPEILKKFKRILIKMIYNKMISLFEFNEILNIFLELDYWKSIKIFRYFLLYMIMKNLYKKK